MARVLITGASGGLGRALAARLHGRGWDLALATRSPDSLSEQAAGWDARLIEADASTAEGARTAVAEATGEDGPPGALAHCVGTRLIKALHRTDEPTYRD